MKKLPPLPTISYGGANYGRLRSVDAGIYYLQDGRLAHFIAEWREGDQVGSESQHLLDISVQIFDKNLELITHSYLFSIERRDLISSRLINWKDEKDRFYFLDPGNVCTCQDSYCTPVFTGVIGANNAYKNILYTDRNLTD